MHHHHDVLNEVKESYFLLKRFLFFVLCPSLTLSIRAKWWCWLNYKLYGINSMNSVDTLKSCATKFREKLVLSNFFIAHFWWGFYMPKKFCHFEQCFFSKSINMNDTNRMEVAVTFCTIYDDLSTIIFTMKIRAL